MNDNMPRADRARHTLRLLALGAVEGTIEMLAEVREAAAEALASLLTQWDAIVGHLVLALFVAAAVQAGVVIGHAILGEPGRPLGGLVMGVPVLCVCLKASERFRAKRALGPKAEDRAPPRRPRLVR